MSLYQKLIVKNREITGNRITRSMLNWPMRKKSILTDGVTLYRLRQILISCVRLFFQIDVYSGTKTYMDEKNVDTILEAPVMADDYALTHKSAFYKKRNTARTQLRSNPTAKQSITKKDSDKKYTNTSSISTTYSNRSLGNICYYCKKRGHVMSDC
jgi:hypothetical protein